MKLLLDENLPRRLKHEFPEHDISTVRENGWSGKVNGELLQLMLANDFEALITIDKSLQHQQNFTRYPIPVILLTARSNKYVTLLPLVQSIKSVLDHLKPGVNHVRS